MLRFPFIRGPRRRRLSSPRAARRLVTGPERHFEVRSIEGLEDRLLLSINHWISPAGGAWDVAANWSSGVPASGDDVTIATAAAATITIQAGDTESVDSLTTAANDTLSFSGGSLTVAANSTLSGPLAMTGGSLRQGEKITFTISHVQTNVWSGKLANHA